MSPPIYDDKDKGRGWMRRAIEASAPGAAHLHPGKEASNPPAEASDSLEPFSHSERPSMRDVAEKTLDFAELADKRAIKATKIAATLTTWVKFFAVFAAGALGAFAWLDNKASKASVEAVAKSDSEAHKQIAAEQAAQNERTAAIEAGQRILLEQTREILSLARSINEKDEKRGSPTRMPITKAGPE